MSIKVYRYLLFIIFIFISSCGYKKNLLTLGIFKKNIQIQKDILITKSYNAADELNKRLSSFKDIKKKYIILTTFVNNDNLDSSNTLGRLIPYIIASRLTKYGYKPIDLRIRKDQIAIKIREGEFILSRNPLKLKKQQIAYMILTGHLSILYNKIYIHVEIVRSYDNMVMASYDFTLPQDIYEIVASVITKP